MAQIDRKGSVRFGDASLSVWEEGLITARNNGGYKSGKEWETKFKKDVFLRIVQQLNRLGWTCVVPEEMIEQCGVSYARNHRYCTKGDLQADLSLHGRCIELEMFQNVNAPDRPDRGGRYQSNKEDHMPYVMRLEMERTRRTISGYLCNVFSGYEFDTDKKGIREKPLSKTAIEQIHDHYAESWHFKGDISNYEIHQGNKKTADGELLNHGQRVWFFDRKGRVCTGIAYYNINNMWWVVTGKYDYRNLCCSELFTSIPDNFRIRRNASLRRKRLESELSKSIKEMNFERAALLRDFIFPKGDLFVVWHTGHNLYHRSGFCGYTSNIIDAGKFTADEVVGWRDQQNEVRNLKAA